MQNQIMNKKARFSLDEKNLRTVELQIEFYDKKTLN